MAGSPRTDDAGASPVVGVVLAVALTVGLASGVAVAFAVGVAPAEPAPTASVALDVDANADALVLAHRGGDALSVDALRVVVTVDGERLAHQPPVPFFAATGFAPGPTGPFNRGYDGAWTAGGTASVALSSTNHPTIEPGDRVAVALYANDALVARASAVARNGSEAGRSESAIDGSRGASESGAAASRVQASASTSTSVVAVASPVASSSSGTRASVVMAMSGSYDGPITRCVTSSNPASRNIRSASRSS